MHALSSSELHAYETLNKYQGARIEFKCDQVTYQGIIDMIFPDSLQVRLRHAKVVEANEYLGNLRFRFIEITSFRVVESVETVNRFPKNEYLLNILRNNRPVQIDSISKALYGDKLSDEDTDTNTDEKKEEKFVLDMPKHLECKLPKDYTLIDTVNEYFYQAIQCITDQQVIGVSFDGPVISRFGKLTWICISTEVCLFLFDMQQLENEAFDKGLRHIFESKSIMKVFHDCRFPSDCLAHQYATVLTNVFDTQVADFVVNMQRYNDKYEFNSFSTLDCCLRNYLEVPQEFIFKREMNQSSSNQEAFYSQRPISNAYLYDLIKSVLYLKLLQDRLSEELLTPFCTISDFYTIVLTKTSKEVIVTLESELSKPSEIPPGLFMHGIQTVYFRKPQKIIKKSLTCKFIDPQTEKVIEPGVILSSSTAKIQNKSKIPSVLVKDNELSETSNQKSLVNNAFLNISNISEGSTSKEVGRLSIKPSLRHIDEVYHKLINKMYPDQFGSVLSAKPSVNYISTFSVKQPSSSEYISGEIKDNSSDESSDISESSSQSNKDSEENNEIWSKICSKGTFAPIYYKNRNVRFVPG